jgi:IS30 family transposase
MLPPWRRLPRGILTATRASPDLAETRRLVLRMEARFMGRLKTEEREQILELAAVGKSASEISRELSRPRSTVRSVLERVTGSGTANAGAETSEAHPPGDHAAEGLQSSRNGHANGASSAELAEVEQLLADRWSRMSLVERLRFVLKA